MFHTVHYGENLKQEATNASAPTQRPYGELTYRGHFDTTFNCFLTHNIMISGPA
jgi:hypothetical protein